MKFGWLLIICIALSGCSNTAPPARESESIPGLAKLALSDCVGFDTAQDYNLDQGPGEAPPGWDFDPLTAGRYGSYAAMFFLTCNRFSGADLERGPVNFLIETHSKFSPPPDCEYRPLNRMAILSKLLVNDPDVAQSLMERGLPAVAATIDVRFDNSTGFLQEWTWSVPGHGASQLQISGQGSASSLPPVIERLISWTPDRLLAMDLTWRIATAQPSTSIVYGEVGPGMLVSGDSTQTYIDPGDLDLDVEASATIRTFGDFECKESQQFSH